VLPLEMTGTLRPRKESGGSDDRVCEEDEMTPPADTISREAAVDLLISLAHPNQPTLDDPGECGCETCNAICTAVVELRSLPALPQPERVVVAEAVMRDLDICDDERRATVIIDALKERRPDIAILDGKRVRVIVEVAE